MKFKQKYPFMIAMHRYFLGQLCPHLLDVNHLVLGMDNLAVPLDFNIVQLNGIH